MATEPESSHELDLKTANREVLLAFIAELKAIIVQQQTFITEQQTTITQLQQNSRSTRTNSRLPLRPMRDSSNRRSVPNSSGRSHPCRGR